MHQGSSVLRRHVSRHRAVEPAVTLSATAAPLWAPSPERIARANLTRFLEQVRAIGDRTESVVDYDALYQWSIRDLELFWTEVWRFCGVISAARDPAVACERVLIGRDRVAPPDPALGPKWFVGSRLNFAERTDSEGK